MVQRTERVCCWQEGLPADVVNNCPDKNYLIHMAEKSNCQLTLAQLEMPPAPVGACMGACMGCLHGCLHGVPAWVPACTSLEALHCSLLRSLHCALTLGTGPETPQGSSTKPHTICSSFSESECRSVCPSTTTTTTK